MGEGMEEDGKWDDGEVRRGLDEVVKRNKLEG